MAQWKQSHCYTRSVSRCTHAVVLVVLAIGPLVFAQDELPTYRPIRPVRGTIRAWGSEQMQELMRLWEEGFHTYQPGVKFQGSLRGTVSAMGGLYGGAADLALMGREIWPTEQMAFIQAMGYAPPFVEVAAGSYDVPRKADALVIFVHKDNPLSYLTLEQLGAIFGTEQGRVEHTIRNWGDLGLTGEWATQAINPYGYRLDNAAAIFFRTVVMKSSLKWNPAIREFANAKTAAGSTIDSGQQILDALAKDRFGIAISNPHYAGPEVKPVALQASPGDEIEIPTRGNVALGRYPLARAVYIVFKCAPGGAANLAASEFLHYVLSAQGEDAIRREGAYMPLPHSTVARQIQKLDELSDPSRCSRK